MIDEHMPSRIKNGEALPDLAMKNMGTSPRCLRFQQRNLASAAPCGYSLMMIDQWMEFRNGVSDFETVSHIFLIFPIMKLSFFLIFVSKIILAWS